MLLLLLASIWGSSFILMKRGMTALDGSPLFNDTQVAGLRMAIAALVLLPFAFRSFKKIKEKGDLLFLAVVGFCGNFFPAFLFTYSETGISSGYAGMLNSCTPVFALLIAFLFFREKLSALQLLGVFIGSVGIVLLMLAGQDLSVSGSWMHVLAIVLATFFYGLSINVIKQKLQHLKAVEITSISFSLLLVPALVILGMSETQSVVNSNPNALEGLFFIVILAVVGTALAIFLFNILIAQSSTLFASSVTYFIPVFAVLMGVLNHEHLTWFQVGSMFIILGGVFVANYLDKIKLKKDARKSVAVD